MRAFLAQLQWKIAAWMQGRRGIDGLSNFLIGIGLLFMIASVLPFLQQLSWVALVCMVVGLLRCCSRNIAARAKENERYEHVAIKPKRAISHMRMRWTNRKTTRYFKCKGCRTLLSVPRGKGKLRVVCPKCKTETMKKS